MSRLGDVDLHLFAEGTHARLFEKLGAHPGKEGGVAGTHFAVWAPNAERVSVVGDFNGWRGGQHPLEPVASSGVWAGFVPGVAAGATYKYAIESRVGGYRVEKADPFGFAAEVPPKTASVVAEELHIWNDDAWLQARAARPPLSSPMSIYEVHLGSWRRVVEEGNRSLTYREAAPRLAQHVKEMGFTHVELLPVMEHPFYGSWGYQTCGYFAPTSRYGSPDDLRWFVDYLHQKGIGVLLDWVPSHFPTDEHGLAYFDGTHLFEHADPRQGFHPDWKSAIFNYGRNEVRSFLLSSAFYWMERFHIDGLRVDAVASMLYLDYSRDTGEWIPNRYGGRENLEAMDFLRTLNTMVHAEFPGAVTIAEESTAWPMVSRPVELGGLGFTMKWDMGWMHDTLAYMERDPIHRRYHQDQLTFRSVYMDTENFVLPLSHDEVVHLKGSLLEKMPGDDWQRRANLRLLYAYMFTQPGKKLLFMGGEVGQWSEWSHEGSIDWHLLEHPEHRGLMRCLGDLARLYADDPALHAKDCEPGGFEWIDCSDRDNSVLAYLRRGARPEDVLLAVFNFTPIVRDGYRIGVPSGGTWREVLNTDARSYGGSGQGNLGAVEAEVIETHGRPYSLGLTLPPLGAAIFRP